jgi:hypothetical protein
MAVVAVACAFTGRPALADTAQQEANKKAVIEFYDKAINQKDFEATAKYFGPHYTQHSPTARGGVDGFEGVPGVPAGEVPQRVQ